MDGAHQRSNGFRDWRRDNGHGNPMYMEKVSGDSGLRSQASPKSLSPKSHHEYQSKQRGKKQAYHNMSKCEFETLNVRRRGQRAGERV